MNISTLRLRAAAISVASRRVQVYYDWRLYPLRRYSIFQEFSRKLKGEIESNPELKKSIKDLQEKAGTLKDRTRGTAEHLYKHVDAARDEAQTKAKQVSNVIKEKITLASEQVKETVSGRKDEAGRKDETAKTSSQSEAQSASREEKSSEAASKNHQDAAEDPQSKTETSDSRSQEETAQGPSRQQDDGAKVKSSGLGSRIAAVAKEGYNIIAEELTSTKKAKQKPSFRRSSATDIVPVVENKTAWRKRLDEMKEKVTEHPMFQRFKTVKEHPVVLKSHEIAEEMRERWETSDSPVVHKIQDLNDSLFGETSSAAAIKEIRNRDPTFSLSDFALEVQEDIRPVLTAYLKGDFDALRKKCSKEVVERCRAEHRALRSQGMYVDNKILYISDVEVKESKMIGNEPLIIVSFRTQQSYCVRDEVGRIKEGSTDDIRSVYYAWAMQQVPVEEMDPEECTPRWQLREMQQLGVQAII